MKNYYLRKLMAGMLILTLMISLTACGKKEENNGAASGSAASGGAVSEAAAEPEATEEPVDDGNLIEDGGFDNGTAWAVFSTNGGSGSTSVESGEMHVSVRDTGDVEHGVQTYYDGFSISEGAEYEFSFDARSNVERTIAARIQINGSDYHAYFEEHVGLTTEMKNYSFTFKMKEASDPAPRLCFNVGTQDADGKHYTDNDLYFDNIKLIVKDDSGAVAATEDEDKTGIRVNQVGYLPNAWMKAVLADVATDSKTFKLVQLESGGEKEITIGDDVSPITNDYAGETDLPIDFTSMSDIPRSGKYKLVAEDGTESPVFTISDKVYDKLIKSTVKMLYMARCGCALDKKYGGKYAHKKCHTKKAYLYWDEDTKIDVSGGWHDAGDYGRYVVSGAKAAADLLLAYDNYKDKKIIDNVGTPQSGDGVDDLLQEAKYELDWLLKMQSKNGLVYHKVTCLNFPGTVMPEDETEPLVISYTSTPATADFVAVMSLAARIFGNTKNATLKNAAKKYLKAAKKSWKYLAKNPKVKNHANPPEIVTGEYPDTEDRDERFWAAAELFRTTGDKSLISFMNEYADSQRNLKGLGWLDCGCYGSFAALMNKNLKKQSADTYAKIEKGFNAIVEEAKTTCDSAPYGINRTEEYEWGSNMGIANDGMMFLMADIIAGKKATDYDDYAQNQLDYLLGKNPTGYCFVTGFGTKSPKSPHHRPSQFKKKAEPGMLVGGVDSGLDDPYTQNVLKDTPLARRYADVDQSYSTNEVCVYWNSPLVFLLTIYTKLMDN